MMGFLLSLSAIFCTALLASSTAHSGWPGGDETSLNSNDAPTDPVFIKRNAHLLRVLDADMGRIRAGTFDSPSHLAAISHSTGTKFLKEAVQDATLVAKATTDRNLTSRTSSCPVGYTGNYCETIVCSEQGEVVTHDGMMKPGELVEIRTAPYCNGTFTFYVDTDLQRLEVIVRGVSGSQPRFILYPPGSRFIQPLSQHTYGDSTTRLLYSVDSYKAGQYTAWLGSSAPGEACTTAVFAPSNLVLDGGFVTSPQDDNVQEFIETDNDVGRDPVATIPSYFGFKVSGLDYPGAPQTVSFHLGAGDFIYPPSSVIKRYNCSAANIAGPQICNASEFYHVKVFGVDASAALWQRVYGYNCDPLPNGEPTRPPPAQPTSECFNDGQLITRPDEELGYCYCGPHFSGSQCETKLCANDGWLSADEVCQCPHGYSGEFCQHVRCDVPSQESFDLSSRALVFIIRASAKILDNRDAISSAARRLIREYAEKSPGYIVTYALVVVSGGEVVFSDDFGSGKGFVHALDNIGLYVNEDTENCTDAILSGLSMALEIPSVKQYKKSPIFIISDALPAEGDEMQRGESATTTTSYRGQIFAILLTDSKCPIDTFSAGVYKLRRLTQFSAGLLSMVASADLDRLIYALGQGLTNMNELVSNDFIDSCKYAPAAQNFFVDSSVSSITLLTSGGGNDLTVQLVDPTGAVVGEPSLKQSFGGTNRAVLSTPMSGNYLLKVRSSESSPCQYRVFATSPYDLFFGTSDGVGSDVTSSQPVFGTDSHIVARFNGITFPDPENIFAELTIWTNEAFAENGSRTVLYASNGLYRDGCGYSLYFGAWQCPRRYLLFYVNVYVTDDKGYTVMRTTSSYCAANVPSLQPATGCLNGGVDMNGDGKCECPGGWTGERCQTIVCQNYGESGGDYCICPPYATGQYCEQWVCRDRNADETFSEEGKSLLLLVHDSLATRSMIDSMVTYMTEAMQDISLQHPRWMVTYTLVRFDDQGYSELATSRNINKIITALTKLQAANHAPNPNRSCKDLLVAEALYEFLSDGSKTRKRGIAYAFLLGLARSDTTILNELYQLVTETETQINVVQGAYTVCGKDLSDPEPRVLIDLAAATGGNYFALNVGSAGKALLTIPTLYTSSMIYENAVDDCSTGTTFYFPIDSQTQSFSVNVIANFDVDPVYSMPKGSDGSDEADEISVVEVWSDYAAGSKFYQILRACDDGWASVDNHCYFISNRTKSWQEARTICRDSNSALATVLHASAESYLKSQLSGSSGEMWLGLNDLRVVGQWEWDQPGGASPIQLTAGSYSDWAANEPNQKTGKCTHLTADGWKVDSCVAKKRFACVRHVYDIDYTPTNPNKFYQLPMGTWSVAVKSYDGGCAVKVFSQSGIQVYNRFAPTVLSDYGYGQGSQSQPRIIAHVTGFGGFNNGPRGSGLQYAQFYRPDQPELLQAHVFNQRDQASCAYEYISAVYDCSNNTGYQISYTGEDEYGYPFQRIRPAICWSNNLAESCENGGVYYKGTCYCNGDYTGSRCQFPYCQNGRLSDTQRSCDCYDGYTGPHCEYGVCSSGRTKPPPNNITLALVIDGSWTGNNAAFLGNLTDAITEVAGRANEHYPGWIYNYAAIVAYDSRRDNGPISQVFVSRSVDDLTSKLSNEVTSTNYKSSIKSRAWNRAIGELVAIRAVQPLSLVYAIGDANAEDSNRRAQSNTLDAVALKHSRVNYFVLSDKTPPGNAQSYTSPSVQTMYNMSYLSGGEFYQFADVDNMRSIWKLQLLQRYRSSQVTNAMSHSCVNITQYVQAPNDSQRVVVEVFSAGRVPYVTLYNNKGVALDITRNQRNSSTNYWFSVASGAVSGLWRLDVTQQDPSPTFCYVSARTVSENAISAAFNWDVGENGGMQSNIIRYFPTAGEPPNAIIATASEGTLTYVQVYDKYTVDLIWASPLKPRKRCAFEYISQHLFTCSTPSMTVALMGYDPDGYPFRRIQHAHCVGMRR